MKRPTTDNQFDTSLWLYNEVLTHFTETPGGEYKAVVVRKWRRCGARRSPEHPTTRPRVKLPLHEFWSLYATAMNRTTGPSAG